MPLVLRPTPLGLTAPDSAYSDFAAEVSLTVVAVLIARIAKRCAAGGKRQPPATVKVYTCSSPHAAEVLAFSDDECARRNSIRYARRLSAPWSRKWRNHFCLMNPTVLFSVAIRKEGGW